MPWFQNGKRAAACQFPPGMGYSEFLKERTNLPKAKISALGCYTPPRVLTNQDFEKMVETNDQWIVTRTGIRERHIAGPEMATSDMAVEAAKCALAQRGVEASEVDTIIVCTVTPDYFFPSTACLVQNASARVAPGDSISSPPAPDSYTASPRVRTWWPPARTVRSSSSAPIP